MKINRHNYEEYFILYMDNELSSGERQMVEAFVQQHPDLKEELDALLQYKLVPDSSIVFDGKKELLKENGHSLITLSNYEEWFCLYTDNELTAEQKKLVDAFIAVSPSAKKELEWLQKTKLQPEEIVFAGKEALYRREEKVKRIQPLRWWRAAAAVLILVLGLTAVLVLNKKPSGEKIETADTKPARQEIAPAEKNLAVQPEKNNTGAAGSEQKNTPAVTPFIARANYQPDIPLKKADKKTALTVPDKKSIAAKNKIADNNLPLIKKEEKDVADNNKPSNNLPQPLNNPNIKENKTTDAVAVTSPDNIKPPIELTNPNVTSASAQPSDIVQASYKENNELLEQTDGKKNKNRGIFRKIARTFEKRTSIDPTDNNRLLVAGLSIKLK